MFEPTTTMTAVKTKTVTRTQMAVALACLGASIIAAAAMSIAVDNASTICTSNAKIKVTLTLGQGTLVNSCKGQLIVPTPKFSQLLVRNYNDEVLTLLIDKKYVTFKVGEDYKPVGKPIGDIVGYQQNLYVAYSGKVDKKADINLFYGYPPGEKGTFCSDTDESQKNFDGSSIKDFKFVNPYVKGTVSYYDEGLDEMLSVGDTCGTYDYGYNGLPVTSATDSLYEVFCSTADGGKYLGSTMACEGKCVDGACVPVITSPVTTSTLPIKTCEEAEKLVAEYFAFCKQSKFDGVCFNKYNLFFQTCTDAAGSGCIINNSSASDNMVCPTVTSTSPVATSTIGVMNFQTEALGTNKLTNGTQVLGKVKLSALNEDIKLNSIKFTIWLTSGQSSTTTLTDLYLYDVTNGNNEELLAGKLNLVADQTEVGKYYVTFDNLNFFLPAYYQQLVNWQKTFQLQGLVKGVFIGSYVGTQTNPAKDIVGTGTKSGQKISPATDKSTIISTLVY